VSNLIRAFQQFAIRPVSARVMVSDPLTTARCDGVVQQFSGDIDPLGITTRSARKIQLRPQFYWRKGLGAEVVNMETHKRYVQGDAAASEKFAAHDRAIEALVGRSAPEFPEGATWLN